MTPKSVQPTATNTTTVHTHNATITTSSGSANDNTTTPLINSNHSTSTMNQTNPANLNTTKQQHQTLPRIDTSNNAYGSSLDTNGVFILVQIIIFGAVCVGILWGLQALW